MSGERCQVVRVGCANCQDRKVVLGHVNIGITSSCFLQHIFLDTLGNLDDEKGEADQQDDHEAKMLDKMPVPPTVLEIILQWIHYLADGLATHISHDEVIK